MYVFAVAADQCDDNMILEQLIAATEQYERFLVGTEQTGGGTEDEFLHFVTYHCNVQSKPNGWLMYSIRTIRHSSNSSSSSIMSVLA